jgi:gliding motility-associated-like protein
VDIDLDGTPDNNLPSGPSAFTYTVTSPDSGRYFVEITTTSGGTITDDILIIFYGVPGPISVNTLSDLSDSNDVEVIVSGGGSYEYSVNGSPFQDSPIFRDLPPGENRLVVNDTNGCGATNPIPFLVIGYPKFFTPNGDSINDLWNVQGLQALTDPYVFIFDRYGKLLKQLDETSPGWDGTFNGRPLPASDYWFRLEYGRVEGGAVTENVLRSHFALKR